MFSLWASSQHTACVGNSQLTRTGFVCKRCTKAAGLIINTGVSGQTKMQHNGRESISEVTSHSTRQCFLGPAHTLVTNCCRHTHPLTYCISAALNKGVVTTPARHYMTHRGCEMNDGIGNEKKQFYSERKCSQTQSM